MSDLTTLPPIDVLISGSYGDSVIKVLTKLSKAFQAKGLHPAVAGVSRFMHHELQKGGVLSIPLFEDLNRRFEPAELDSHVRAFEAKYSLSMREFCFAEAQYLFCRPESLRTRAVATFLAVERLFNSVRPAFCVAIQGNELITNAFYAITKARKIPMFSFGAALPHIKGKGFLHTTDKQDFNISAPYRYEDLSPAAIEQARTVQDQIVRRNQWISYYNDDQAENAPMGAIRLGLSYIAHGELGKLAAKIKTYLTNRIVGPWRMFRARRLFAREIPQRFVFFPLHQPNDSNITVCNPMFFRQEWIVEYIARCLPPDVSLVVKPHPGVPLPELPRLRQITGTDNVHFVRPEIKAAELIERSAAVVVVNSSVGLEAFARGKPVLVLGDFPLKGLRGVHVAPDLRELRTVLQQTIDQVEIPERFVLEGLYTIWANMSDGYLWDDAPNYDQLVDSALKAAALAGAVPEAVTR